MAADAFLGAFLRVLICKLADREVIRYFGRVKGIDKNLKKWSDTLSAIEAVLNDAEERQLMAESTALKLWLDNLRDLAFDAEDVLDKCHTKMLKRLIQHAHSSTTSKAWKSIPNRVSNFKTTSKAWKSIPNRVSNFKMNSEIQKITKRLQVISERKDQLGLKIDTGTLTKRARQLISPSSSLPDGPVIGREEDKRKIVELLLKQEHRAANFYVVAIVGMPGVGKTTLAGQVLKDMVATQMFQPAVWVCVSDDFNLERVTKQILESITSQQCTTKDYNKVQNDLHKKLAGKKFLIVLDDVWKTCSHGDWKKLQSPFIDGAHGSKIIVTTRDKDVSKMMGAAMLVHNLKPMEDDVCLQVFEQHAFLNANDRPPNYELLRKKIVARCRGSPLAARTLGGVLLCKEINDWEETLSNKLWSLSKEHDILRVLRLSYFYLPSHLKRCFAYCSILPNDYEFGEMQMILLWMAEGLIHHQPEDNKQIEDLGADYFRELVSRSLFQKSTKNTSKYVMHDLIGDLARWAAGDVCFRLEDKQNNDGVQPICFSKARHSSYLMGEYEVVKRFEAISEVKCLRTFLPLRKGSPYNYLGRQVTFDLLPKLQYLRVLSFNGYRITELPNSIGDLRYLRYLDLSYTAITSLPKSTSTLYNLQTLILEGCSDLKSLPADMSNLANLRHLNNSDVSSLEGMPPKLGRLVNLQSLPNFVVSAGSDQSGIREIGPLSHLQGTLCISRLENVTDVEDAQWANLKYKVRLDSLVLKWSHSSDTREMESTVLDMLEPHREIKELTIKSYAGKKFSSWVGSHLFSNMGLVRLEECNNCLWLPPLGQLPQLKELYIRGMNADIASHVAGGCWYVLAIQRVASCLRQHCDQNVNCNLSLSCSDEVCYQFLLPASTSGSTCGGNTTASVMRKPPLCLDVNGTFNYGIYQLALPVISSNSLAIKILYPIFWGLMTLSTFGNDLEPTSHWLEVIFSICIVLSGLLLFTLLIGNIQVFLHAVMAKKRKMQLRCRDMEWWMKRRQLPSGLRRRVRHYERHRWVTMGGEDEMDLIKDLPEGLRREIKRHLCLELIKKVPLFDNLDDLILDNICDRVRPLVFSKDEKIIREGDPVPRMLFIVRGRIKRTQGLSKGMVGTNVLEPGGFFGDELLSWCLRRPFIDRLPASSATFTCIESTEAFGLNAVDLRYITDHFRYKFANERLKRTARYYSSNWRTWAAVNIQFTWRRYRLRTNRGPVIPVIPNGGSERKLLQYAAMFMSLRPHDHLE